MAYVVFARKWRPKNFEEVVGQEHISETLKNAIAQDRVAHAYLFSGPRGIGKTTTARILAKALNCQEGPTTTPCNKCDSCKEISEGRSLDVIEIDGASNRGIEEVRTLRENVKFKPSRGKFKLYIIDEVHMLTQEAFNALLKTLEEPPAHVKFIFATTQRHKVIPTILSRCQRFDFRRIPVKAIVAKLQQIAKTEKLDISEEALFSIARSCEGSMRDAESILDQLVSFCQKNIEQKDVIFCLGITSEDVLFQIAEAIAKKDTVEGIKLVNKLVDEGKDLFELLSALLEHFRNLSVIKAAGGASGELIELPKDAVERLVKQSQEFSLEDLLYIFQVLSLTQEALRRSKSSRIVFEMCILRLTKRESLVSLDRILKELNQLEDSAPSGDTVEDATDTTDCPGGNCPGHDLPEKENNEANSSDGEDCPKEDSPKESPGEENDTKTHSDTKAEEKGSNGLSLVQVKQAWPALLKKVKQEKMSAALFLLEGRPSDVRGTVLTIDFPQQFTFYKEALEGAENKKLLEKCLQEILDVNIKAELSITYSTKPHPESKSSSSDEDDEQRIAREEAFEEEDSETTESSVEKQNVAAQLLTEPIIQSAMDIFNGKVVNNLPKIKKQ